MANTKTTTRKTAKRKTTKTQKENYFWVTDGTVIRSVKELAEALDQMDHHIYEHHANFQRNDFASWVENVFQLDNLGRELRCAYNKDRAVITVLRHLVK